jgi:hypothetical protein
MATQQPKHYQESLSAAIVDLNNLEEIQIAAMDVAAEQDGVNVEKLANEPGMTKSKFKLQLDKLRNEREAKVIKQNDELFDKVQAKADELPEAAQGAYVDVFATSLDMFDNVMGVITETVIKFFFSAVDQLKNIVLAAVEQVKKVANLVAKGVKKVGKWFGSLFRSVAIGAVLLDSGVLEAGLPVQVAVGGAATVLVYDTELGSMTEMTEYNNESLSKHLTYSVHDERMAISHDAVYDKDGMIVQLLTNSEVGGKYMFWVHSIGKK